MMLNNLLTKLLGVMLVAFAFADHSLLTAQQEAKSPNELLMEQLISVINSSDEKTIREFTDSSFAELPDAMISRLQVQMKSVVSRMGKLTLESIKQPKENSLIVLCATANGPHMEFTIETTGGETPQIRTVTVAIVQTGDPAEPLSAEERTKVIEVLAQTLETKYVFPDVGKQMAQQVRKNLEEGKYNEIENISLFAQTLTRELREICSDKHLSVRAGAPQPRNGGSQNSARASNYGFAKVEMLPGNIGYLKFDYFDPSEGAKKVAAAAMQFLENADAIIFDLRENGGGSPEMIAFLQTYLFDKKVHLNSFYNRAEDSTSESWTLDEVPGKRFGEKKPVYVLTSSYTFSGAEEFSYNLQQMKRGTIVGEKTGGGAHPVRSVPLGKRMGMSLPFARAINPISKTNWEGIGVIPHVAAPSDQALQKATELAQKAIADTSKNDSEK
jgi:retinol-binding protein 3